MLKRKTHSIRFWLWALVVIIILPMMMTLVYVNSLSRNSIRDQVARTNQDMLRLYQNEIDRIFDNTEIYFYNFIGRDQSVLDLRISEDELTRRLAKVDIYSTLTNSILLYHRIDCFFYYSQNTAESTFIYVSSPAAQDTLIQNEVGSTISGLIDQGSIDTKNWFIQKIKNDYFIIRIIEDRGVYVGAWVNVQSLLNPLVMNNLGNEGYALICSPDGTILNSNAVAEGKLNLTSSYSVIGETKKYLQISQQSTNADFYLVAIIPDKEVTAGLKPVSNILIIMSIAMILLIPLSLLIMQQILLRPLDNLLRSMAIARKGDLGVQINSKTQFSEFQIVNDSFNDMMSEIKSLKINIYEKQLSEKETLLQYYQLQIHPHFILNCLNLVHGLAGLGKLATIQELSQYLVRYLRYVFRKPSMLSTVDQELVHVRNYVKIQEIRYPQNIIFTEHYDDELKLTLIPPLIVQSFIENSAKYAMSTDKTNIISVSITKIGQNMLIRVKDNGPGYPVASLKALNAKDWGNHQEDPDHLGIFNVYQRLHLIYGDNVYLNFYNADGAVTEIVIPITNPET